MNLKEALLKEHSKKQCSRIVAYIGNDKVRFGALMKLFFEGQYRVTQRAAWPMSYCIRSHPALIKPFFKPLLDNLGKVNLHDAVIRNTVRLLQDVEVPKKYHGKLMNICFEYIQANGTAVAIKAFCLTILKNLAVTYPEIVPEIKLIVNERWDHETSAFRTRAKQFRS
jgi:hypothetical protein